MIGDDLGGVDAGEGLVQKLVKIDAGRTDNLGDNNTLCTVDDEGPAVGHQREVPHEDLLLFDLVGLTVAETHSNLQGSSICGITGLALFHVIFGICR